MHPFNKFESSSVYDTINPKCIYAYFESRYITLWSILMKDFDAMKLAEVIDFLSRIRGECYYNSLYSRPDPVIDRKCCLNYMETFKVFEQECSKLRFITTMNTTQKIIKQLSQQDVVISQIDTLGQELIGRLSIEMNAILFFSIDFDKQYLLKDTDLFGVDVSVAFPTTGVDIKHAGRCLAFNEWGASVFHCMRILEIGLIILAKELKVQNDLSNWGGIIQNIETQIKNINPTFGIDWKNKRQLYSDTALEFRFIKDAWRNHIMHGTTTYDDQGAIEIFEHTKRLMQHVTVNLKLHE
jgi:hypothetical protein